MLWGLVRLLKILLAALVTGTVLKACGDDNKCGAKSISPNYCPNCANYGG